MAFADAEGTAAMSVILNMAGGIGLTLSVFLLTRALYQKTKISLLHPVGVSVALIALLLLALDIPYSRYFSGAAVLHFLLGPATVALAIPLFRHFGLIRPHLWRALFSMSAGLFVAAASAMMVVCLMGGEIDSILSIAPKSVTTPIAMGISEKIGGIPALTALIVIFVGVIGVVIAPMIIGPDLSDDPIGKGIALGASSHGVGTAYALETSESAGAAGGVAIALSGVLTALILPWMLRLFGII